MKNLITIQDIVEKILREEKPSRDSDHLLYYYFCKRVKPEILEDKYGDILLSFNSYELPTFESVSRIRRKVQYLYPELKSNKNVEDWRREREEAFEEYSRLEA